MDSGFCRDHLIPSWSLNGTFCSSTGQVLWQHQKFSCTTAEISGPTSSPGIRAAVWTPTAKPVATYFEEWNASTAERPGRSSRAGHCICSSPDKFILSDFLAAWNGQKPSVLKHFLPVVSRVSYSLSAPYIPHWLLFLSHLWVFLLIPLILKCWCVLGLSPKTSVSLFIPKWANGPCVLKYNLYADHPWILSLGQTFLWNCRYTYPSNDIFIWRSTDFWNVRLNS
jgi:hypothetical protein